MGTLSKRIQSHNEHIMLTESQNLKAVTAAVC